MHLSEIQIMNLNNRTLLAILAISFAHTASSEENELNVRFSEYTDKAREWLTTSNLLDGPISAITVLRESGTASWDPPTKRVSALVVEQLVRIRDKMRDLASCDYLSSMITDPKLQVLGRRELLRQCTSMLAEIKGVKELCDECAEVAPDLKLQINSSKEQLDKLMDYTIVRGDYYMKANSTSAGSQQR